MGKNRGIARAQNKSFQTPQEGPVQHNASTAAELTAGRAPQVSVKGYPLTAVKGGTPPVDQNRSAKGETRVRSGTDPDIGKANTVGSTTFAPRAGAAPVAGMSKPGGGKSPSDVDNQRAQIGRNGYAKGGKVKAEERNESAKEKAREVKAGDAYAKGGKVNRHGVDKVAPQPTMTGNAVPLAQPGGTPSTGITAGGTLPMTSDTMGQESTVAVPKLRSTALKRSGTAPSLPRPRR